MKKFLYTILFFLTLSTFLGCSGDSKLDKCIKKSKGCSKCIDPTFFSNSDQASAFIYGNEFVKENLLENYPNNTFPYVKNSKDELKIGNLYFDISAGLAPAVEKFENIITSFKSYIGGNNLKLWEVSYKNGKHISDTPRELKGELIDKLPTLKNPDHYKPNGWSYLEGALKQIIVDTSSISLFITDFILDKGDVNLIKDTKRSCYTCSNGENWGGGYFLKWFDKGGKLIVVTTNFTKKTLGINHTTNAYAIFFIPKGHKYKDLYESLIEKADISKEDILIIDPSALSINSENLSSFTKNSNKGKGAISILSLTDRYMVIGADNKKLEYVIKNAFNKVSLPLINETNIIDKLKLTIEAPVDCTSDIISILKKNKTESNLLGKNQKLKTQNPIKFTSSAINGLNMELQSVPNVGKNDILIKKQVIHCNDVTFNLEKIKSNVTCTIIGDQDKTKVINNCLFSSIDDALNGFNDKYYKKIPLFVIYSIVNVKHQ